MRYRAGSYATVNVIIGFAFTPALAALVVVGVHQIRQGISVGWSCFAALAALIGCVAMACTLCAGVSSWRAVTLSAAGLSVPGFTLRRGFFRDVVPLADINDVQLMFRSSPPHNSRWQLVITRRHGARIACDSITAANSSTSAKIKTTRAWRKVDALRSAIRACARLRDDVTCGADPGCVDGSGWRPARRGESRWVA